jgi:hypothetical protein
MITLFGASVVPAEVCRTTRTEQFARSAISFETLPRKKRPSAVRPCEPTIIKSGCHSAAIFRSSSATLPTVVW